jgi:hypothetical protein
MRVCGRPQDPDVRFCAPTATSAEARSAPTGVHPGRRVRRRRTWGESLRRPCLSGKGFPFSRGAAARRVKQKPPRGYCDVVITEKTLKSPAATSNSPTRVQVKLLHLTTAG